MDLRTERTKKNIINAFIELRSRKDIEKITVKELCELAYINKATFYRHYEDIYALSDAIETELIQNCLSAITEPIQLFDRNEIRLLVTALSSQGEVFDIIFSGSRQGMAIHKIYDYFLKKIFIQHPEYENDPEKKIILTTLIYGMFQTCHIYKDIDSEHVIESLAKLNHALLF